MKVVEELKKKLKKLDVFKTGSIICKYAMIVTASIMTIHLIYKIFRYLIINAHWNLNITNALLFIAMLYCIIIAIFAGLLVVLNHYKKK